MPRPWIKSWTESLDNPKVMSLAGDQYKVWDCLCRIAGRYDDSGLLPPLSRCAFMLHKAEDWLRPIVLHLVSCGLIDEDAEGYRMHDWQEWQSESNPEYPSNTREAWRERKRKQREREAVSRDVTSRDIVTNDDVTGVTSDGVTVTNEGETCGDVTTANVASPSPKVPMSRDVTSVTTDKTREEEIKQERGLRSTNVATAPQAAHRAMYGALCASFGDPAPGEEHRRYEKAAASLIRARVEPAEIPQLHEAWGWVNPGTPRVNSLASQLTVLRKATGPPRASPNGKGKIAQNEANLREMAAEDGVDYDGIFSSNGRSRNGVQPGTIEGTGRALPGRTSGS